MFLLRVFFPEKKIIKKLFNRNKLIIKKLKNYKKNKKQFKMQ